MGGLPGFLKKLNLKTECFACPPKQSGVRVSGGRFNGLLFR